MNFRQTYNSIQLFVRKQYALFFITSIIIGIFSGCSESYTPKKKAYFRIDFPKERHFVKYESSYCPFTFEYADLGQIQKDSSNTTDLHEHPCWFNIVYLVVNYNFLKRNIKQCSFNKNEKFFCQFSIFSTLIVLVNK